MTYPIWSYFPRNVRPPRWAASFVEAVSSAQAKISTASERRVSSDAVLQELAPARVCCRSIAGR
jgi:hypothetical protein